MSRFQKQKHTVHRLTQQKMLDQPIVITGMATHVDRHWIITHNQPVGHPC